MSEQETTTAKGLTTSQIDSPALWELLKCYAGEVASPCVAEALIETLNPNHAGHVWQVN